jgi:hypothetical protein
MLRQFQPLALVIRDGARAVKELWRLGHFLVDEAPNHLAILQKEWNFVAADFENRAGARTIVRPSAEARIEKACVMHSELAHRPVDRNHLGGEIGRDLQPFPRCQDVKFARVEDQPFVRPGSDRVPLIGHPIRAGLVHIENIGMFLRFVPDHAFDWFGA